MDNFIAWPKTYAKIQVQRKRISLNKTNQPNVSFLKQRDYKNLFHIQKPRKACYVLNVKISRLYKLYPALVLFSTAQY
jgi:glyoxylate carboligase